jgi:cell division protein FtsQ
LAVLSLIAAAAATYAALVLPWPRVESVRVEGATSLDVAAVVQTSGLLGSSLIRPPTEAAEARLARIPQVRSVRVERDFPFGLSIRIEERQPWGFWSVNGVDHPVDETGVVLEVGVPDQAAPRIVAVDTEADVGPGDQVDRAAVALAGRLFRESPRFLGSAVRELEYRPSFGITAVLDGGTRVVFGDDRYYEYKVAVLSKLLEDLQARGITPASVDLRYGDRVVYE